MHERKITTEYNVDLGELARKKRVCAYARVSSDRDEAFHSLSAQVSYYQRKIAEHPNWEFVEVFSDRGLTGTKETREGFQRMLTACREKKVDIILVKSITRFARNTMTLLETVRELKGLGIDIHFEEEHIETLSEKGELMISILAARAQEESRQASENQKWHYRKSYEKGIPVNGNCLGYRLKDHQFLIEEDEEEIVNEIFSLFLSGMGKIAIAKRLINEGIPTMHGRPWNPNTIDYILRNEKYTGTLLLQKAYKSDHITKKKVLNRGERPKYLRTEAHDAIIQQDVYDAVKAEMANRAKKYQPRDKDARYTKYPYTKMIICGQCNSYYHHKTARAGTKYAESAWSCGTYDLYGKEACTAQVIPDKILREKTCDAIGITSLDGINLNDYLEKIVIPEHYVIVFVFKDGTEKRVEWKHSSRRNSWTPEMKEQARKHAEKRWRKENPDGSQTK